MSLGVNLHLAASSAASSEDFTSSGSSNGSGQMFLGFFPSRWEKNGNRCDS